MHFVHADSEQPALLRVAHTFWGHAVANSCKSGEPILHWEPPHRKNCSFLMDDLKHLNAFIKRTFWTKSMIHKLFLWECHFKEITQLWLWLTILQIQVLLLVQAEEMKGGLIWRIFSQLYCKMFCGFFQIFQRKKVKSSLICYWWICRLRALRN
jgi:hypothetical protein